MTHIQFEQIKQHRNLSLRVVGYPQGKTPILSPFWLKVLSFSKIPTLHFPKKPLYSLTSKPPFMGRCLRDTKNPWNLRGVMQHTATHFNRMPSGLMGPQQPDQPAWPLQCLETLALHQKSFEQKCDIVEGACLGSPPCCFTK